MKSLRIIILGAVTLGLGACAGHAVPRPNLSGSGGASLAAAAPAAPALARAVPRSVASAAHQVQPAVTTQSSTFAATSAGAKVQASIDRVRHSRDGSRVADFSAGSYKGKNVIIIQVESLDAFLIGKKYEGHEITPNLNKLLKQSWYWPNTYSETGMGNTADAEFIVNTSLYAPRDQAATVKYTPRTIPGLPRVLRGNGYYTFTIHQNKVQYWNRRQMYVGLGFNRWYDYDFFHGAPKMGPFGASDEELFKRVVPVMHTLDTKNTPFYSQIITLSSHGPFDGIPESRRPVRTPKDLSGSLMGKYISA
jgi:lipoteichoic acid synthase